LFRSFTLQDGTTFSVEFTTDDFNVPNFIAVYKTDTEDFKSIVYSIVREGSKWTTNLISTELPKEVDVINKNGYNYIPLSFLRDEDIDVVWDAVKKTVTLPGTTKELNIKVDDGVTSSSTLEVADNTTSVYADTSTPDGVVATFFGVNIEADNLDSSIEKAISAGKENNGIEPAIAIMAAVASADDVDNINEGLKEYSEYFYVLADNYEKDKDAKAFLSGMAKNLVVLMTRISPSEDIQSSLKEAGYDNVDEMIADQIDKTFAEYNIG
jgi:hypothetical protein